MSFLLYFKIYLFFYTPLIIILTLNTSNIIKNTPQKTQGNSREHYSENIS